MRAGGTASLEVGTICKPSALAFRGCPFFDRPLSFRVADQSPILCDVLNLKLFTNGIKILLQNFHTMNVFSL